MKKTLKILILEDSQTDAELVKRSLLKVNMQCEFFLAMDKKSFLKALEDFSPDIILSDNSLPQFNATEALKITRELYPEIPFILVTGTVSDEFAANIIKSGADDYILKDRLTRLPVAIDGALRHRKAEIEKIEAGRKLQYSEENYRSIMERVSDAFVGLDENWHYTYVNKKAGVIMQRDPESLIGKHIWTEFPEGVGQAFYKAYYKAMEEQHYIHLEEYYPPFDLWLENHIYPSPKGLSIFFKDITDRKRAETNLLQTQMRLEQAQEIAHLGNWEINFANNKSKWSDEAYRIYGLPPGDHNMSMAEWMSFIHPADLDFVRKTIEDSQANFKDIAFHHRIIRKDGVVRCVYSQSKFEFDKEGKPIGSYGIVLDETESKKAEQDLRHSEITLKEAQSIAHISNWEIDLEHNIHTWSDEFYRIYGINTEVVKPSEELFLSFMHPDDSLFAREKMKEAFDTLKDSSFNYRFIRKDRVTRHGYTQWKFEFNKEGRPIRLFGILQDITERVEAEQELRKLEQELLEQQRTEQLKITATTLEAQERERNAIGQELHDNVNQILVGTKLVLSMIKDLPAEYQNLVNSSMDNLQDAINENRKIAHVLVAPDLESKSLTDQIDNLTESMLKVFGIDVQIAQTGFLEELLNDEQRLAVYRILQEQCTNIIKYADARLVKISLQTINGLFQMIIADDGKGMKMDKKTDGIGLRNIKARLSIFNGTADIHSAPGKGFALQILFHVRTSAD